MMCLKKLSGMICILITLGFSLTSSLSSGQTLDPPPGEPMDITCCQADADGCTDRLGGYWEYDRTYFNIKTCP